MINKRHYLQCFTLDLMRRCRIFSCDSTASILYHNNLTNHSPMWLVSDGLHEDLGASGWLNLADFNETQLRYL